MAVCINANKRAVFHASSFLVFKTFLATVFQINEGLMSDQNNNKADSSGVLVWPTNAPFDFTSLKSWVYDPVFTAYGPSGLNWLLLVVTNCLLYTSPSPR